VDGIVDREHLVLERLDRRLEPRVPTAAAAARVVSLLLLLVLQVLLFPVRATICWRDRD
jgi:hypothetical protein